MKTVLLSTSCLWNCGDDFIREGLLRCLNLRNDVQILWYNRGWGIEAKFANSLAVNLDLADYIIMAGTPEWVDLNEQLYQHAIRFRKRIALLGVGRTGGYLPEKHKELMDAVAEARVIDMAIARDEIAPRYLKQFGLSPHIHCDPALFLKPLAGPRDLNILGYRAWGGLGPHEPHTAHDIKRDGPSAELDSYLLDAWHAMSDPKCVTVHDNREICTARTLFGKENVWYSTDPWKMYEVYGRCAYYIGARIHGFVAALVHGAAAHLIYPTDKAVTMETAIKRLGLKENHAQVHIMGRDSKIKPQMKLEPIGNTIEKRLAEQSHDFRRLCRKVPWLKHLMQ